MVSIKSATFWTPSGKIREVSAGVGPRNTGPFFAAAAAAAVAVVGDSRGNAGNGGSTRHHPTRASIFDTTSSASSSPSASSSGVPLSNSTIISIGLGFVAFGFGLFFLTLLIRVHQVYRLVQRQRAEGTDVQFREQWDRMGGWWGYFVNDTGDGRGGGGAWGTGGRIGIGAGGWGREDVFMARVLRELERRTNELERSETMDKWKVPKIWEVNWDPTVAGEAEVVAMSQIKPISLCPETLPNTDEPPDKDPTLSISVFIRLPHPPRPPILLPNEDDDDPPDVVLGLTTVLPFINLDVDQCQSQPTGAQQNTKTSLHRSTSSLSMSEISLEKKELGSMMKKHEIEHVEGNSIGDGSDGIGRGVVRDETKGSAGSVERRRAKWIKKGDKWFVEGLSDLNLDSDDEKD